MYSNRNEVMMYRAMRGVLIAVWGIWGLAACQPDISLTPIEQTRMQSYYTSTLTPRCFGRYLIDLPADLEIAERVHQTLDYGIEDITIEPMSKAEFDLDIAEYEKYLRETRLLGSGKNAPTLLQGIEYSSSIEVGKVFHRIKDVYSDDRLRVLDLWGWQHGYQIRISVEANDGRLPKYKEYSERAQRYDVPQKLKQLLDVYSRTRGRKDQEVPTEPGFCIRNGIIVGTADDDKGEYVLMDYHLKGTDDVYMVIETSSKIQAETNLLERGDSVNAMLREDNGKTVRKGEVVSKAGVPGQEWLTESEMLLEDAKDNRLRGAMFHYEAFSKIGSAKQPVIIAKLWTAAEQDKSDRLKKPKYDKNGDIALNAPSLSLAEAVALWDAVIPTIRPRPGAF